MGIQTCCFYYFSITHKEDFTAYREICIRGFLQFIYVVKESVYLDLIRYTVFCIRQFIFKISAGYYMGLIIFFP